jgi:hypothetical protein
VMTPKPTDFRAATRVMPGRTDPARKRTREDLDGRMMAKSPIKTVFTARIVHTQPMAESPLGREG